MKKVNLLIIKAFIGPFLATFLISMFLFLMLFLWKYIDDLIGKGLEWHVVARLLFYSMADLIPMALPLAVLLSSLMTYGNLSESYELVALKASGISIYRALRPVFIVIIILALVTFYVSNIVIPKANLEAKSLLWDIRNKKPAFDIKEGLFYNGIDNYQIKIGKKDKDNETIHDVLIYEIKPGYSQLNIVRADKGLMKLSDDKRLLYFTLYDGVRYEEMVDDAKYSTNFPATTTYFDQQKMTFDLSDLDLKMTDKELFKGSAVMMNIKELNEAIDSCKREIKKQTNSVRDYIRPYYINPNTVSVGNTLDSPSLALDSIVLNFSKENRYALLESALNSSRNLRSLIESTTSQLEGIKKEVKIYEIKWHEKFTLSFVLIVLFVMSAPLGTIIRKGGIGVPMIFSIVMFILYYVINMIGFKMGREGIVPEWLGAWMSSIILLPLGIFILTKAAKESALLDKEKYQKVFVSLMRWFTKPKLDSKS
ncbi:MAG: LptF/LptG family permease [Bacteroidota bacterium]|nr:LptF/LptG family permease [Bacteroidota bacterium]